MGARGVICQFFVPGMPKGQARPRAFARKVGDRFVARVYDSGSSEGWKGAIALAAKPFLGHQATDSALRLEIDFYLPRPKSACRKCDPDGPIPHTGQLDIDNLTKSVMDALQGVGFVRNDGQFCELVARKWYHEKGGFSGAHLRVFVVPEVDNYRPSTAQARERTIGIERGPTVGDAVAGFNGTIEDVEVSR